MTRETASEIADRAARWVAQMASGEWNAEREAELGRWREGDPRREGALLQAQAALAMIEAARVPALAANDADRYEGGVRRRQFLIGGGAAVAGVAASIGFFDLISTGSTYRTKVGEIRRIPLDDGSTAAINTASRVSIDLRQDLRLVEVSEGEAWFQVAKDRQRPFLVEAGRVRVRAVGTAFSVRRLEKGADVLVTEGVVEVWADGAEGHIVRIAEGNRAYVGDNSFVEMANPRTSSVDRSLAWRAGKIDLVGQPLSEAVAEFNRYNKRKIVLLDPALGAEQFDGIFRTDDPIGFAEAIRTSLNVPLNMADPLLIQIGSTNQK